MEIRCNFRTYAGREASTDQFTSKIHNYFYTNRNEVIQKPKLLFRKSSFNEKYQKNANTHTSIPDSFEQWGGFLDITSPVFDSVYTP